MNARSNPFLLPGSRQDRAGRSLPDRADGAPALAEGLAGSASAGSGGTALLAVSSRCIGDVRAAAAGPHCVRCDRFAYALRSGARRPPGDNSTPMADLVSELLAASLDDLMAEARRAARRARLVTYSPEGLHPADDALPRRLRLLHVRPAAAARRAGVPHRGRGARDRARGSRGGLHRGAVHARRQARAALPGRPRRAGGARLRDDARVPRALRGARPRRRRAAPAPEPRRDDPRRARAAPAGRRLDGDHARDDRRAARGEGRAALGLARQGPGAAARDDPARGRARDPVHERDPDRDRRDPGGADRRAARAARARRGARPPRAR